MKLFHTYDKCFGFTLWRWNFLNIELWFVPPKYSIVEHSHPSQDIELIFLQGEAWFHRRNIRTLEVDSFWATNVNRGKKFTIKTYHSHWFDTNRKWLIFLNIERWYKKPTSAAEDFQVTFKV